jgi:hypothetical protein
MPRLPEAAIIQENGSGDRNWRVGGAREGRARCWSVSLNGEPHRRLRAGARRLVGGAAYALDDNGRYMVVGMGAKSCGSFIEASRNNSKTTYLRFETWLTGYLSAYNRDTSQTYDIRGGSDLDGINVWLENYCRANPLETYIDAVYQLTYIMYPNRIKFGP